MASVDLVDEDLVDLEYLFQKIRFLMMTSCRTFFVTYRYKNLKIMHRKSTI